MYLEALSLGDTDPQRDKKTAKKQRMTTYKGTHIRLLADFSRESPKDRREWNDILKILQGKNCHPRILYPAKLSFRYEGEILSQTNH